MPYFDGIDWNTALDILQGFSLHVLVSHWMYTPSFAVSDLAL